MYLTVSAMDQVSVEQPNLKNKIRLILQLKRNTWRPIREYFELDC